MNHSSMCSRKASFRTKAAAQKVADKFNQRVYECPICFCFHCTRLENWRDEFVRKEHMDVTLSQQENKIRYELNAKIKELRDKVQELERENKRYRKELAPAGQPEVKTSSTDNEEQRGVSHEQESTQGQSTS